MTHLRLMGSGTKEAAARPLHQRRGSRGRARGRAREEEGRHQVQEEGQVHEQACGGDLGAGADIFHLTSHARRTRTQVRPRVAQWFEIAKSWHLIIFFNLYTLPQTTHF